jgi:hypothetical protein
MMHSRVVMAAADLGAEAASMEAACVLVTSTAAADVVTILQGERIQAIRWRAVPADRATRLQVVPVAR